MNAFARAYRELRALWDVRKAAALACSLVASFSMSYQTVIREQLLAGGALAGSTAWDLYYVMVNNQKATALLIPSICLFICGDVLSKDRAGGMDSVVLARTHRAATYWQGKVLAVFVTCFGVSLIHCLALTLGDVVLSNSSLSLSAVPAWLAYEGGSEWSFRIADASVALIPAGWNYGVLLFVLVVVEACKYACIVLVFVAICRDARVVSVPFFAGAVTLLVLESLPLLYCQVFFLMRDGEMLPGGLSLTGWPSDRLCLSSYALGADFTQICAGGSAAVERAREAFPDIDALSLESLSSGYRVNSYAGFTLMLGSMFALSCVRLSRVRPRVALEAGLVAGRGDRVRQAIFGSLRGPRVFSRKGW